MYKSVYTVHEVIYLDYSLHGGTLELPDLVEKDQEINPEIAAEYHIAS